MFRSELRRAFLNPFFFLALMLGIVSIMGGVYQYTNGFRPLFPDEPLNTYNTLIANLKIEVDE